MVYDNEYKNRQYFLSYIQDYISRRKSSYKIMSSSRNNKIETIIDVDNTHDMVNFFLFQHYIQKDAIKIEGS